MYILLVDDDKSLIENLAFTLEKDGHTCFLTYTGQEALQIIEKEFIQLCFLDYSLSDTNGLALMSKIKTLRPNIICIFITGTSNISVAVEATKCGAYDFIEKPFELARVKIILNKVKHEYFQQTKVEYLEKKINNALYDSFVVGNNRTLQESMAILDKVAKAQSFSVLIRGETGTGKELMARYLHQNSPRKNQPFIEINCSAIPAALLESELFGYEKGAFTGADSAKPGLFELANQGTLFLDEIGDMPLEMQSKLLRALETKTIRRLGGVNSIAIDIAVISATHRNLERLIEENKFREDLYYRINVVQIAMPPLRERKEDIPQLVKYFIDKFNLTVQRDLKGISKEALDILYKYNFPGNIRELKNIIERAMLLETGEYLSSSSLNYISKNNLADQLENVSQLKKDPNNNALPGNQNFNSYKQQVMRQVEKEYLIGLLKKTNGNVTMAAQEAGLQRTAFSRLLSKHELYFKNYRVIQEAVV